MKSFTGKDFDFTIFDYPVSSIEDIKGYYKIEAVPSVDPRTDNLSTLDSILYEHNEMIFHVIDVDANKCVGIFGSEIESIFNTYSNVINSLAFIDNELRIFFSPEYIKRKEETKKENSSMNKDFSSFDFIIVNRDDNVIVGLYKLNKYPDKCGSNLVCYDILNLYTGEETNSASITISEALDKVIELEYKRAKEGADFKDYSNG